MPVSFHGVEIEGSPALVLCVFGVKLIAIQLIDIMFSTWPQLNVVYEGLSEFVAFASFISNEVHASSPPEYLLKLITSSVALSGSRRPLKTVLWSCGLVNGFVYFLLMSQLILGLYSVEVERILYMFPNDQFDGWLPILLSTPSMADRRNTLAN